MGIINRRMVQVISMIEKIKKIIDSEEKPEGNKRTYVQDKRIRIDKSTKRVEARNSIYANRFVWEHGPNIIENDPTSKFDISFIKQYWIFKILQKGLSFSMLTVAPEH